MDRSELIAKTRRAGEVFESPQLIEIADLCERLTAENKRLRWVAETAAQAIKSGDWNVDGACDPGDISEYLDSTQPETED